MKLIKSKIWVLAAAMIIGHVPLALAVGSGAFNVELSGTEALAKGNAFVGEADNPSAVYFNPAGLTQLQGKSYMSAGFTVLAPYTSHTDFAGNETQMARQNFKIPHIYMVSDLGTENFVFGLGGTSNWGSSTLWADDSFSRYVATESDIFSISSMLTTSYRANDQWSFGAGVTNLYTTTNKSKKLRQTGGADGDFSIKADDTGWGYNLSTLFKLNEEHQFGLIYKSSIQLKYRGKVFLEGLNASGSNFLGIFGDDSFEVGATSESEFPQSVVLGYSYSPEDSKWLFNVDVEWMDWSSIEQDLVEFTDVLTANQAGVLNAGNPAPVDWNDVWSVGLGVEYQWNEDLRLRGGTLYHQTPIPEDTFNSNLPDADSLAITGGFGYDINDNMVVDLSYAALFFENRTIDNAIGNTAGGNIDGKYEQLFHIGMATFTYGF